VTAQLSKRRLPRRPRRMPLWQLRRDLRAAWARRLDDVALSGHRSPSAAL